MKYFVSKNALFCRNFYQIVLLFLKNPVCKLAVFIPQNLFHKNLNGYLLLYFLLPILLSAQPSSTKVIAGAERTEEYLSIIKGKKVGLVANHTSMIGNTHLLDSLLNLKIQVTKVFCPEHGFRGTEEAGANIQSSKDKKTGLPIISLHGKNKKPQAVDLADLDILIFDIQDVGARFYTYISTLHYVMEAAAENNKELIVFDRPNPNGFYVDGPVLDTNLRSFVGMHPVPIVHGLTIGEYALMINGEHWLANQVQCGLTIIPMLNYTHQTLYALPILPSPNLPTMNSIYLYPSLCLFEGTPVSIGRGTPSPFEIIGSPKYKIKNFSFTPKPIKGASENPPFKNTLCYGINLKNKGFEITKEKKLNLSYLMEMYKALAKDTVFFQSFFDKLAGTKELKKQIEKGFSENEIRRTWEPELSEFKERRKKYLLYEE